MTAIANKPPSATHAPVLRSAAASPRRARRILATSFRDPRVDERDMQASPDQDTRVKLFGGESIAAECLPKRPGGQRGDADEGHERAEYNPADATVLPRVRLVGILQHRSCWSI